MPNLLLVVSQPLFGGLLIGLASWLLLASLGRIAGISGIASEAMSSAPLARGNDHRWRWLFLSGLMLGGFIATFFVQPLPLPASAERPWAVLLAAGLLVGYGTVIGSGCTSGHGVCGLGRRSGRSLVATLTFMASGMATVFLVQTFFGRSVL